MTNQAQRRAATRSKLIAAARKHFARSGYDAARTEDILADAGVSRGALYHHFPGKRDLFEAVFLAESEATIEAAARSAGSGGSPLEDLIEGCLAWMRAARRPEAAAILLDQGPQVLGWTRARQLEEQSSLGLMKRGLERAMHAGETAPASLDLTARLINAALAELALASAQADPPPTIAEQEATLRQLIEGLRRRS